MFLERTMEDYLDRLASKEPVPGGGSAAALAGAMGAGLVSMVAHYSLSADRPAPIRDEVQQILDASEVLRKEFQQLSESDAQVYSRLSRAFSLPKGTEDDRAHRSGEIQSALKAASEVPLRTAEASYRGILLADRLIANANPNLISDVGVAVFFLQSALQSAILNVEVNLRSIKDDPYKRLTRESYGPWVRGCEDQCRSLTEKVAQAVIR